MTRRFWIVAITVTCLVVASAFALTQRLEQRCYAAGGAWGVTGYGTITGYSVVGRAPIPRRFTHFGCFQKGTPIFTP